MMSEALNEQNDSLTDTELTESPHFDETAIAAAQPVEPLPPRHNGRATFSRSLWRLRWPIGALIILACVATLVAAFILVSSHRDILADNPETANQPESSSTQVAAPSPVQPNKPAAIAIGKKPLVRRSRSNPTQPRTTAIEDQSKPAARKVGVITYGRAPNNR